MIELKCKNCGGKVRRDESQVFVSENAVIVLAGHGFECEHCGSRFEPGTTHEKATGSNTQIAIGNNIAQASGGGVVAVGGSVAVGRGGIAIKGSVGGDIIVGDKRTMIDRR